MIINSLKLVNFRNYAGCDLTLSDRVNVFVGKNAQGKTNLLESLLFVSTTRSFRTSDDQNLIKENETTARVSVGVTDKEIKTELTAMIAKEGKHLFVQKQPVKRSSQFIGKLNAILFSPSDFELFDGSPRVRRRFIDMEISKVIPNYALTLNNYNKLLKERNNFLKQNEIEDAYVDILTDQLVNYSLKISRQRRQFFDIINSYLAQNYETIAHEKMDIKVHYYSIVDENDDTKSLKQKYQKVYERNLALKQTNIGIHKDDFSFWMNLKDANSYASQGQKRMMLLSLKLALIGYIRRINRKNPVLLLDDVLSELDEQKQRNLLSAIPENIQTIITTTSIEKIQNSLVKGSRIFEIQSGQITSVKEVV